MEHYPIYTLLKQAIKQNYLKRTERIQKIEKIQAQPRNLGNNSPPSRNPNGSYKKQGMWQNKNCQQLSRPVTKQPA
jgi:hypothetical protein